MRVGLRFQPLGSGSRGNAALVQFGEATLLVDAGLSARAMTRRLVEAGVEPSSVSAIVLSHEHQDHSRGAQLFSRQHQVTVACSRATLEAMDCSPEHFHRWESLPAEGNQCVAGVNVRTFPVPHDAARPVGFVLERDGLRVGVATDLGHATTLVRQRLLGCHLLMIESNYDPVLLNQGRYPWQIKQRVSGRMGHLSNAAAAALLGEVVDDRCYAVVLAHLSENNNRPELARQAASGVLAERGYARVRMRVASPRALTPALWLDHDGVREEESLR